MALTAVHHGRSRAFAAGTPHADVRAEAESFATGEYATLLARGASMPAAERERILARLADLVGLAPDLVARAEGRITIGTFSRELLRDERKVLGLYDATITASDPFPDREEFAGPDPTLAGIDMVFTTAINRHLRSDIGVRTDREYVVLSDEVNTAWRNDAPEDFFSPPVGATDDFRYGMALNPHMKAFITHGRYDLVTPYYASDRLRNLMRLDPEMASRLTVRHFERRAHVLRLGGQPARVHRRDRRVRRRRAGPRLSGVTRRAVASAAALQVAPQVLVVGAELPVDGACDDRREQAHRPLERSLRCERHDGTAIGRDEHPPAIDWLWSLDDVGVKPAGALELGKLDQLLEFLAPGDLRPLPDAVARSRLSLGEDLDPRLGGLPIPQVRGIRHVVEHGLGRPRHLECLLDPHAGSFARCPRRVTSTPRASLNDEFGWVRRSVAWTDRDDRRIVRWRTT